MDLRRNILLFHLGALGDFIMTWPLALALARLHPQSRIFYVTHGQKGLLAERALRVESLDVDSGGWHRLFSAGASLPAPAARTLAGAHTILNFVAGSDDLWTTNVTTANPQAELITLATHAPPEFAGHQSEYLAGQMPAGSAAESSVKQILRSVAERGIGSSPASRGVVVIHPGSGSPAKCWPVEHYIDLAARLSAGGLPVRLLLGEVELERWPAEIIRRCRDAAEVSTPATLIELMNQLSGAAGFIGNDSGPGHLAGILGVPTLSLFGEASDPTRWKPLGPHVQVLHGPLAQMDVGTVESAFDSMLRATAAHSVVSNVLQSADDD